ncbi:MAG: hypothetical protein KDA84_07180 [Planctomycetaceae bacterium]|nr:hypothetical protein [Planctomycetaceae bacterium]
MSLNVRCDECGKGYRLKPELAGTVLPCRECGAEMLVPGRRGGRSSGEIRTGQSSAEFRARGTQPRRPRRKAKGGKIPTGVWVGGGVGLLLVLVGVGIFLWTRMAETPSDGTVDSENSNTEGSSTVKESTWSAPPEAVANLGQEVAIGAFSIKPPKGWMPFNSRFGRKDGVLEWRWPDEKLKARLMFNVTLDPSCNRGDEPNIMTGSGSHSSNSRGKLYLFAGANPPEEGLINGVPFHRVAFPENSRPEPLTHVEYITILDGASVRISLDVNLPSHTKLCGHAEAAALSFSEDTSVAPTLSLADLEQSRGESLKGFPQTQVVSENPSDYGVKPKYSFLGKPEFAILLSDEAMKKTVISTPKPNYVFIDGVVYSLLDHGKEVGRFTIPTELKDLDHIALRDDGKMMAFADDRFTSKDAKINLLSEGGKVWNHLQESQTRARGSIRLNFIRFLPNEHLAAGWDFSDEEVDIYNLKSGEQKRFVVDSSEKSAVAFSPDGRFFLSIDKETYKPVLTNLENPEIKSGLQAPSDRSFFAFKNCKALEFSPDGKEVAGIVSGPFMAWSINGELFKDAKLPPEWYSFYDDEGAALQWLHDGKGWLVWNRYCLDRKETNVRWSLPKPNIRGSLSRFNRILPNNHVLIGQGDDTTPYSLAVFPQMGL